MKCENGYYPLTLLWCNLRRWILTQQRMRAGSPGSWRERIDHSIGIDVFLLIHPHISLIQHFTVAWWKNESHLLFGWLKYLRCQWTGLKRTWEAFVCITCSCWQCWESCESWKWVSQMVAAVIQLADVFRACQRFHPFFWVLLKCFARLILILFLISN